MLKERKDHRLVGGRIAAALLLTLMFAVGWRAGAAEAQEGAPGRAATAPAAKAFADGQSVEVKWGGQWRKAVVVNHRGEWILIDYDGNRFFREWVEPWRVRAVGSKDDFSGPAPINPYVRHNEGPPREKPGPAPANGPAANAGNNVAPGGKDAGNLVVTPVARQNVKMISVEALPALRSLPPDPAPAVAWAAAPIDLRGSTGEFFDKPEALLLSPASGIGAVLHFNAPPGKGPPQCRLERLDLKAGQALNVAALPFELEPFDLSGDGKLLLSRTGMLSPAHGARLDVWQVDGDKAAHVLSFQPFTPRTGGEQVVWARFIGPDHVLARSFDGELSCYTLRQPAQIWSAKLGPGSASATALSATAKYVAAATGNSISILDTLSGKPLGRIDLADRPAQSLAFKADGKQIAVAGQDEVAVWNLGGGPDSIAHAWSVGAPGQSIEWGAEGYLLLDHSHLVSLNKELVVWTYRGVTPAMHGPLAQTWGGRMYYTADAAPLGSAHKPVVASVALPDDAVHGAVAAFGEPALALKPGVSISLEVTVDASIRQQVTDALTAKLKANGNAVAANQPIKLIVTDEPGQSRDVEYRRIGFGARGRSDKVKVQELKRLISLVGPGGKALWQRGGTMMPPFFLQLKQGQSIDAAVAEAMKPSAKFYESVRIPKLVAELSDGVGITQLTAAGPQPPARNVPKKNRAGDKQT